MSQSERILTLLAVRGPAGLTALEALEETGTLRLAARVADLRAAGEPIITKTERTPSGKHVARYIYQPHGPANAGLHAGHI